MDVTGLLNVLSILHLLCYFVKFLFPLRMCEQVLVHLLILFLIDNRPPKQWRMCLNLAKLKTQLIHLILAELLLLNFYAPVLSKFHFHESLR